MSVATTRTERDTFTARAHARAVRRVVRSVAGSSMIVGAAFWVIFTLVAVAVPLIVDRAGNDMRNGVLVGAEYSARWFAFTLAIIMVATITTNHVAAGGTRRALFAGSVVSSVVVAVLYGAANVAALLIERAVFGALGWTWHAPIDVVDPGVGWFVHNGLSEAVVTVGYVLVGVAVATAYQTHGAMRGTVLLVPSLAILFVLELATGTGSGDDVLGRLRPDTGSTGDLLWLAGSVVAVLLAALWARYHLSRLRLRPTR
ncbi:hypothetical protein ACNHYB_13255 [Isoptericola jiangsuensis]|uniref:hypothetical protein n=1 Tax=Isoptericola jiangsuensis TaxID=548579 RepID=UPI003AAFFD34